MHQHGMLQNRTTYEIMRPEDVGYTGQNMVLGKHSGRHAFRDHLKRMGHELSDADFQEVFDAFIALCDRKKDVYDADIAALIDKQVHQGPETWKLVSFHTFGGTGTI